MKNKIEVDIDKLITLYCTLNNNLHGNRQKSLKDYIFGGKKNENLDAYFSHLIAQVVDILDSGLKDRSNLAREITPFIHKTSDIKKNLKL